MAQRNCRSIAEGRESALPPPPPGGEEKAGPGVCGCPFCSHAVEHAQADRETARLAMVSHLVRVHAMTMTRLLLEFHELEGAILSYFPFRPVSSPFTRGMSRALAEKTAPNADPP